MGNAIPRIIRARRVMVRAAELLEEQANGLFESHSIDGEWWGPGSQEAWEAHDELKSLAKQLREFSSEGAKA